MTDKIEPMSDDELAKLHERFTAAGVRGFKFGPNVSVATWMALKDRLDAAEAVVGRLTKTADGVPITPYMSLWQVDEKYRAINDGKPWSMTWGGGFHVNWLPCYSTREACKAALAARDKETPAK